MPPSAPETSDGFYPHSSQNHTSPQHQDLEQLLVLLPGPPPRLRPKLPTRSIALICAALAIYTLFMYVPTFSAVVSPCRSVSSCLVARSSSSSSTQTFAISPTTSSRMQQSSGDPPEIAPSVALSSHFMSKEPTDLRHIVFGIASTASNWPSRQEYVKLWWQHPDGGIRRRGFVWLDEPVLSETNFSANNSVLPDVRISGNTDKFPYTCSGGSPSAVRISRIVSETFRLGLPDVRWFVMGDDDTIFFPENVAAVLRTYDHRKFYYIGQSSESQKQSAFHSFRMAYGGGGIAISYPLAEALEAMQDDCLSRYPDVYGSDSRIEACVAELGVPLTKEQGFHQIDLRGDTFGLLAAHPVRPFVSLHHIDNIEPIFPDMTRIQALQHLVDGAAADPAGTLQQSICYDMRRNITLSVSWAYAVQVFEGILTPLEVQKPSLTFLDWRSSQPEGEFFTFDVRRLPEDVCKSPAVFFMQNVSDAGDGKTSIGVYKRREASESTRDCHGFIRHDTVEVHKQRQSESWLTAPQRQGCEVVPQKFPFIKPKTLLIYVRDLRRNEVIAPYR